MPDVVFDASAFYAFLTGEPGADAVETVLMDCRQGEHRGFVHALNLYEIERKIRVVDPGRAEAILKLLRGVLRDHCIMVGRSVTLKMQKHMVSIKMAAGANFSALDAACVAYATTKQCLVLTTDHGEMDKIESAGLAQFLWAR